ncbi:MAG: proton-conducting membrane transporter, partial [Candidatus Cloacimonetes bacterium]|nr:proton-conducting membrane transporter [Candidatus Cloacimonadota bacterium]
MVNPLFIFIISFAVAFLLGFFQNISKSIANLLFYLTLGAILSISGYWLYQNLFVGVDTNIYTAGFKPPFSINLRMGLEESLLTFLINLVGLFSSFILGSRFKELKHSSAYLKSLYIMLIMGLNGIIMTRDIFNLFVFLEIASIATYSLIAIQRNSKSLSAGFKYLLAGGIASSFFLLGTIYLYRFTGTLNLDIMISSKALFIGKAGSIALFFLLFSVLLELKPFPANGWALDIYQAVDPSIVSVIAVASSGALFFTLYKFMPLLSMNFINMIAITGITTFLFSNLLGLKQKNVRRLLGYSSIAQIGLLVTALALLHKIGFSNVSNPTIFVILGGFFLNHFFAKAGLFWLADIIGDNFSDWSVLKRRPFYLVIFGSFIFALVALPPFPGFWAKWTLITQLATHGLSNWIWVILLGSLFEAIYLIRWFVIAFKGNKETEFSIPFNYHIPISLFFTFLAMIGLYFLKAIMGINTVYLLPVMVALVFFIIDWLPHKIKGLLALASVIGFGYFLYPFESKLQLFFGVIFIIGSAINIIATLSRKELSKGLYSFLLMMIFAFGNLIIAKNYLEFFLSWEFITMSSFILILRGRKAKKASLMYMIFSISGAYLIMAGFSLAPALSSNSALIKSIANINLPMISTILLAIGFMIKSGSLGLHIWLPEAHAEAESDVSPFISAILLKAGVWGMLLVGVSYLNHIPSFDVFYIIGWIGVLTAIFGAFLASFEEDAKRLLAYSSMSQVGYIIASIAILSHLGWVSALYLSFNHMMFKSALFIAVAGIYYRTHTRTMYEMGGLIKKMPLSFITVLISIIAVSGVPPLSGFGSKWLIYSSLIEKGWYFQAGVLFFASAVSFLYLYRIIHTIFLGQLKYKHQEIKEAPLGFIIPQYIFLAGIMAISMYPNLIIKPLNLIVGNYFNSSLVIDGYNITNSLGNWNGNMIMYITMGVFAVPLIFLIILSGKIQKVKQFNIVYAAERPESP